MAGCTGGSTRPANRLIARLRVADAALANSGASWHSNILATVVTEGRQIGFNPFSCDGWIVDCVRASQAQGSADLRYHCTATPTHGGESQNRCLTQRTTAVRALGSNRHKFFGNSVATAHRAFRILRTSSAFSVVHYFPFIVRLYSIIPWIKPAIMPIRKPNLPAVPAELRGCFPANPPTTNPKKPKTIKRTTA